MGFSSPQQGQLQGIAQQQQNLAGQAGKTEQQLIQPLLTGNLPPAAQQLVARALQANLANDRSQFAKLGLTGSTMESTAENEARQGSVAQTFGIEEDMAKLGQQFMNSALQGLQGAAGTTQDIAANQTALDDALMKAIGSFGQAIGGAFMGRATGGAAGGAAPGG